MNKESGFIFEVFFIILIGVSSLLFFVLPANVKTIVDIQLFFYFAILWFNYRRNKSFNLYQIWIVAYVFMVWAEMEIIASNSFSDSYIVPFARFSLANFSCLLGYHLFKKNDFKNSNIHNISKGNNSFVFLLLVLYIYFVVSKFVYARTVFYSGRTYGSGSALGNGSLLGSLTSSLGLMIPALIGYYFTQKKHSSVWMGLLWSLPIFIILLLTTSRYKFLFSILPFLIVTNVFDLKTTSLKKNLLLFFFMIAIVVITGYIKNNRGVAFAEMEASEFFGYQSNQGNDAFEKMAYQMSPEGVVRMASVADQYFSTHSLHYGKETGFILIFWVPRSWWPNKPTMLDNWLIREYEQVADGFSSASGFIGELRADFGWLCLAFMLLFGLLLRKLDNYTKFMTQNYPDSFNMVLISILYPWVFFFVRSPLTATMSLLLELLVWKILVTTFSNKVHN
jgi:oligosaccharide repeat unit polymerase